MANDYEIFEGKTLSDVFKDIYDNSKTNKQQLEVLMKEVVGFIKDGDTAVQIIPMLKEYLEIKKIKLRDLNILGSKKEFLDFVNVKVRSTGRLLKAKIDIKDNYADVEILDKETGISPGQACVFYSKDEIGDKVLGGGWIHKTFNKNLSTKLTT